MPSPSNRPMICIAFHISSVRSRRQFAQCVGSVESLMNRKLPPQFVQQMKPIMYSLIKLITTLFLYFFFSFPLFFLSSLLFFCLVRSKEKRSQKVIFLIVGRAVIRREKKALFFFHPFLPFPPISLRMPREIITIQVGQCGNQSESHLFIYFGRIVHLFESNGCKSTNGNIWVLF